MSRNIMIHTILVILQIYQFPVEINFICYPISVIPIMLWFFVSFFANHHQRVTSNLCVPIRQNINPSTKTLTSYITRPAPRVNLFFESIPHRYASLFRRRTFAENAFSPKKIMPPILSPWRLPASSAISSLCCSCACGVYKDDTK